MPGAKYKPYFEHCPFLDKSQQLKTSLLFLSVRIVFSLTINSEDAG